jgi:hypothetical protein
MQTRIGDYGNERLAIHTVVPRGQPVSRLAGDSFSISCIGRPSLLNLDARAPWHRQGIVSSHSPQAQHPYEPANQRLEP